MNHTQYTLKLRKEAIKAAGCIGWDKLNERPVLYFDGAGKISDRMADRSKLVPNN